MGSAQRPGTVHHGGEKSWWRQHEAVGHVHSQSRSRWSVATWAPWKWGGKCRSSLSPFYGFILVFQPLERSHPQLMSVLPMIRDLVKLTININHQKLGDNLPKKALVLGSLKYYLWVGCSGAGGSDVFQYNQSVHWNVSTSNTNPTDLKQQHP